MHHCDGYGSYRVPKLSIWQGMGSFEEAMQSSQQASKQLEENELTTSSAMKV